MDPIQPPTEDLRRLRECRDCGLLQAMPERLAEGERAACARCGATMARARGEAGRAALACAAAAAALFVAAISMPFLRIEVAGRAARATVFTGPEVLSAHGLAALAVVVVLTIAVVPAAKLGLSLAVLLGARAGLVGPRLAWAFGWLERMAPWAMVEVFFLGVIVAYTRLAAMARVELGPALFAVGGMVLTMAAADWAMDRDALWQAMPVSGRVPDNGQLLACATCDLVNRAREGEPCARCRHRLAARKPNSASRVWALVLGAAILYLPANVLPVMTVERLGRGSTNTILGGVRELAAADLWPLAVLVFVASFVVPILKLVALATMLIATRRRSAKALRARTRLFRFVDLIGRWSMIDVFMLATLVGLVHLGLFGLVLPGDGALAFCGVVVLTMAATQLFDPRLMWDAAEVAR